MKYVPQATDGRTDGRAQLRQQSVFFFLEKKKNTKNAGMNSVCQLL